MHRFFNMNKHSFKTSARGMGTVEVVIIIAILISLALVFRSTLTKYAQSVMNFVFDEDRVIGEF